MPATKTDIKHSDDPRDIHPGTIIRELFMPDLNLSDYRLAKMLRITQSNLRLILNCERGVTANVALRLGKLFSQTPQFWLNLQNNYDLKLAQLKFGAEVDQIDPLPVPEIVDESRPLSA